MTTQDSVATAERFAQGLTWDAYRKFIGSPENLKRPGPRSDDRPDNTERLQRNIDQFTLTDDEVAEIKALPKLKLLAIGEDWCPDVYRGLPIFAAMAEAAGWEYRLFQRDDNMDIMSEFMNEKDGQKFQSIPVAVFYTEDHQYITHWIERPQIGYQRQAEIAAAFKREEGETEDDMRDRLRARYRELQQSDEWDEWRHATVREILDKIKTAG